MNGYQRNRKRVRVAQVVGHIEAYRMWYRPELYGAKDKDLIKLSNLSPDFSFVARLSSCHHNTCSLTDN